MPKPELIAYIKEQFEAGVKQEDIKAALLSAGWDQETIDNSFRGLSAAINSSRSLWKKVVAIAVILFISTAGSVAYYFLKADDTNLTFSNITNQDVQDEAPLDASIQQTKVPESSPPEQQNQVINNDAECNKAATDFLATLINASNKTVTTKYFRSIFNTELWACIVEYYIAYHIGSGQTFGETFMYNVDTKEKLLVYVGAPPYNAEDIVNSEGITLKQYQTKRNDLLQLQVVDCGEYNASDATPPSCFDERLKKCEPTTLDFRFTMTEDSPNESVFQQEIYGWEDEKCAIKTTYIEGTLIELVGSDGLCRFTKSEILESQPAKDCQGRLFEVFGF